MNRQVDSVVNFDALSSSMFDTGKMPSMLNTALELFTEVLTTHSCFIAQYEREMHQLKVVAAHNRVGGYNIAPGIVAPLSQSLLHSTDRTGRQVSLLSMHMQNGQAFFSPSFPVRQGKSIPAISHRDGKEKLEAPVSVEERNIAARIGSYIAVPIVLADDTFFGMLCAIDPMPLDLYPLQDKLLIILSRFVATQIERDKMFMLIKNTQDESKKMSDLRSNFFSVVNHEFRTKLTSIQGFSELMRDQEFSYTEIKEFADDIHTDARQLSKMINELLDLERMESGESKPKLSKLDLNELIVHVVEQIQSTPSHPIHLELDKTLPLFLGDYDKLSQVIKNLLNNAIKYSPNGGTIRIHTQTNGSVVHVSVHDQGIGIPADCLEQIFEPYYSRAAGSALRYIKGTGLGLSIVRRVVQLHGGKVWAESIVEQGSILHVTLPLFNPSID